MIKPCLLLLALVSALSLSGKPGDTLYVSSDFVDLKSDPDPNSETVIRLSRGHKLFEFEKDGKWVMVGAEKTGGKDGWLPVSFTSTDVPKGEIQRFKTAEFKRFEEAFWQLSNSVERQTGTKFFTDVEYMGDGIVNVTATDIWLAAPKGDRKSNLNTIYNLWEAAEGTGFPIAVYVYDKKGKVRMKQNKKM